jgi:hypothetical protein
MEPRKIFVFVRGSCASVLAPNRRARGGATLDVEVATTQLLDLYDQLLLRTGDRIRVCSV